MILCQTCLREYPDGTTQCVNCGQPLALMRPSPAATGRPFPDARPEPVATVHAPRVAYSAADGLAVPDVFAVPDALSAQASMSAAEANIAAPLDVWVSSTEPLYGPSSTSTSTAAHLRLRLNNGKVFELSGKALYLIGREDPANGIDPDIDLTRFGGVEGGVSRSHAVIHVRQEGYFVEDLGSMNETLLNFHRLLPRQLYELKDGDQLRFGGTTALVVIG